MAELSDQEIADAAREAGISPAELRQALAEKDGALVRTPGEGRLPASVRGKSVTHTESSLPYPPEQAVRTVKHQIERQIGSKGHMMGSKEADIYDERSGMIYRIQAESDGGGGALVRVDVDPTPLKARRTLTGMGLGSTVGLLAVAGIIVGGLVGTALFGGAIGLSLLGLGTLVAMRRRGIADARAASAYALIEAEHAAPIGGTQLEVDAGPRALPPGSGDPGPWS